YGSVFKNPDHELTAGRMLESCGLRGHRIGGAQISPRHANFIENADGARSEDALGLMAEARRRAWEQYGADLEHEVVFLGALELAPLPKQQPAPGYEPAGFAARTPAWPTRSAPCRPGAASMTFAYR